LANRFQQVNFTRRGPAAAGRVSRVGSRVKPTMRIEYLPPLSIHGQTEDDTGHRINRRWLLGAVLAVIAGSVLLGSAMQYSIQREYKIVMSPDTIEIDAIESSRTSDDLLAKGDRLQTAIDITSARQNFKSPVPVKIGDKEIIKLKPYVKLSTNLTLNSLGREAEVPAFDPMKVFASSDPIAPVGQADAQIETDADVALRKSHLIDVFEGSAQAITLNIGQVLAQVEDSRQTALQMGRATPQSIGGQQLLARTLPTDPGLQSGPLPNSLATAFSSIQISVIPENVTAIERDQNASSAERTITEERTVSVRRGDSLERTLTNAGIKPEAAKPVADILAMQLKDRTPREGTPIRLLVSVTGEQRTAVRLLRAMILDGDSVSAIAAINDRGAYVAVIPPTAETTISADEQPEAQDDDSGITIYQSLYETAIKNDIPRSIIEQLVRIFFYDIDLQRKVVGGDALELFYAEDEENPEKYDLLYASLSIAGVTKRYFPFKSDDGSVDFFDEQGKSNRKFLVRKPITEGILRSGFGMRFHPILKIRRLHAGVDWANKIGTPIIAAGDGVITKAEWTSGYGRHIAIQHAYDFETTYSHLSGYAKGVVEGARVRQGQVIGYLGSSGLSTGPHLHYEVKVKGEYKDPLALKLPKNRELNPKELIAYKTEKTEIESIMAKAPNPSRVATNQQ